MILGLVSFVWVIVWAFYFRNDPKDHPGITQAELDTLPPRPIKTSKVQVPWGLLDQAHVARDPDLFLLRLVLMALYLSWIPLFFKNA